MQGAEQILCLRERKWQGALENCIIKRRSVQNCSYRIKYCGMFMVWEGGEHLTCPTSGHRFQG
jgi:hypothetical protein